MNTVGNGEPHNAEFHCVGVMRVLFNKIKRSCLVYESAEAGSERGESTNHKAVSFIHVAGRGAGHIAKTAEYLMKERHDEMEEVYGDYQICVG